MNMFIERKISSYRLIVLNKFLFSKQQLNKIVDGYNFCLVRILRITLLDHKSNQNFASIVGLSTELLQNWKLGKLENC